MGKYRGGSAGQKAAAAEGDFAARRFDRNAKADDGPPAEGSGAAGVRRTGVSEVRTEEDLQVECDMGFEAFTEGEDRLGWLMNMNATTITDESSGRDLAALACYFMCQDGSTFKADVPFTPYFYLVTRAGREAEVENFLRRKYEGRILDVTTEEKEDLDLKNHLSGIKRRVLKVSFYTQPDLLEVKREALPAVARNRRRAQAVDAYQSLMARRDGGGGKGKGSGDALDLVEDLREYDVPYHMRFSIDTGVRCGSWFEAKANLGVVSLSARPDIKLGPGPRVCAFDIECSKQPLKFPNAEFDQVTMISYMLDKQGYLIINREWVSEDVQDFEYTPKPEFEGNFIVWNERDERALLRRWFDHMRETKPGIFVTFNGDWFDFPFIERRAKEHGMDMYEEIGFRCENNVCLSKSAVHMDALCWVRRDSYLPQGSQGLKAVTKAKLGYNPLEVAPEDMVRLCHEQPQVMASYSVSDAVATYYLYMTYVHQFIFSLSTIIPLGPDDVLRKGSGTLCESLLMVEAFQNNILAPNKHQSGGVKWYNNHPLNSETYIGGHVECLQSGVYRSDIPTKFSLQPAGYQRLLDNLDRDLHYAIEVEGKLKMDEVTNYGEVRDRIASVLKELRDNPEREEKPTIYHLDVSAMYPNIILTNRLQPSAMVSEDVCAACDYNRPGKTCLRELPWVWRGEHFAATRAEYAHVRNQLESEEFPPEEPGGDPRTWRDLKPDEKTQRTTTRLKQYTQKAYARVMDKPVTEERRAGICQRENSFYVDTVQAFRDRRYEYKGLTKTWAKKAKEAEKRKDVIALVEAKDLSTKYDSLQLAHKCILNSFYGYVMRKGARWYSMEMAGAVTLTGANIIKCANDLIHQVGKPLELDTDGIWCCLPGCFPEDFTFTTTRTDKKKEFEVSYPCVMLNVDVARNNTNDQYATLVTREDGSKDWEVDSRMTIEFEVDGPYKAMILPASQEEGKLLKKRYAVFNPDGSLAELKGFELKRRGELNMIKIFQSEVFGQFLKGATLEEVYGAVAAVADRWIDMLQSRGEDLVDEELLDYISESTTLSKTLEEYGNRRGSAVTTAKRLAEFLGADTIKDKGLSCEYIVSREPPEKSVSDRCIPVMIFSAEASVRRHYLRRWTRSNGDLDLRNVVDWEYYKKRIGNAVQKIITIPAALQGVANPVPRVRHPDWLLRLVREQNSTCRQQQLSSYFTAVSAEEAAARREAEAEKAKAKALALATGPAGGGRDLEDAPGAVPSVAALIAAARDPSKSAKQRKRAAEARDDLLVQHEQPDRRADYSGWLQWAKARWRRDRAARKRRRIAAHQPKAAAADAADAAPGGSVASGVSWHVVQIRERLDGRVTLWAVVGGALHAVPLEAERVLYVNMHEAPPPGEEIGSLCMRTLPRGRQASHLYEVRVPNEAFSMELLRAQAADPNMEGVYEAGVGAARAAAIDIGAMASPCVSVRRRPLGDPVRPHELRTSAETSGNYLRGDADAAAGAEGDALAGLPMAPLYLYHSASGARGLYALHMPSAGKCKVVVVAPPNSARDVAAPALERAFRQAAQATAAAAGEGVGVPAFEVEFSTSFKAARKRLARHEKAFRDSRPGGVLAVVELPGGASAALGAELPALDAYPVCEVPAALDDSDYPRLGWQPKAALLAAQRCALVQPWLAERIEAARVAATPLGNLTGDALSAVADALFARALRASGHLLWCGDDSLSGARLAVACGGGEDAGEDADAALALAGSGSLAGGAGADSSAGAGQVASEEASVLVVGGGAATSVDNAGAYREVCVEVRLHHLAVNSLIKSGAMAELEGTAAAAATEVGGAGAALRVLRRMVEGWLQRASRRDAQNRGDAEVADSLLRGLQNWLATPSAALHEPALLSAVRAASDKCLVLLLAELGSLGGRIVHADADKIVVATGRQGLMGARAWLAHASSSLRTHELFQWLHLEEVRYFRALLWRDAFNYGGVEVTGGEEGEAATPRGEGGAEGVADSDAMAPGGGGDGDNTRVLSCWNLAEYLPEAIQDQFLAAITAFLVVPWRRQCSQLPAAAVAQAAMAADGGMETDAWLSSFVRGELQGKMLRWASDIAAWEGKQATEAQLRPPPMPGALDAAGETAASPSLKFVKAVCHVLALDARVASDVTVLRRALLKKLHVREFAPGAAWREPCAALVVPGVVCAACGTSRDLDVARDPALLAAGPGGAWHCATPGCGAPLDKGGVEDRLVAAMGAMVAAYQSADLRCVKCNLVKVGAMAPRCECSGALRPVVGAAALRHSLRACAAAARFHGMAVAEGHASALAAGCGVDGGAGFGLPLPDEADDEDMNE